VTGLVQGGRWTVNGKSGTGWYHLSTGLYAAVGWFTGTTGATA
jgi:hypothetical protein